MNAKYVVFDGMDGSGKGTQMDLLQRAVGDLAAFTREPGGTPFAEKIRDLVRNDPLAGKSTALNNFLLFWAAREELQHTLVAPTLEAGKHVFSDRGDSSTYAFQLWGEQHRELLGLFKTMRKHMLEKRHPPDLYIIFDLPADVARARVMMDAARERNHFDDRDLAYYERVREGFQSFAKNHPVEFIDATWKPAEIHRKVLMTLATHMVIPSLALFID